MSRGPDSAKRKLLLRDAKFYADNAVDPGRLKDAVAAAGARKNMLTKAEFRAQCGLAVPRASQAWKHADVFFDHSADS